MKFKQFQFSLMVGCALFIVCVAQVFAQAGKDSSRTSEFQKKSDNLRIHRLTSKIFENTRTIRVLLPPGYDKPENRKKCYPVLYLNDGQNLFDVSTSVFNPMEWQVDETVDDLIKKNEIKSLIVVGIDNAGKRERENEYLPYEDKYLQPPLPNPEGEKYPDFLTQEVLPFINRQYRVRTGAENTALGGSSYGALISLYAFIKRPDVFGRLLLESPSFYVSDAQILKEAEKLSRLPKKIYIGVGTNETGQPNCAPGDWNAEAVEDVLKLKKILQDKKLADQRLKVVIEDCAAHNESVWAKRLPAALKFLFPF